MTKSIAVLGSGFSSLAAACYLARAGNNVTLFEKNKSFGGRARQLKRDGFVFDMGPTWYWMPDVFERFFGDFDKKPKGFYELIKLSPAYSVYFGQNQVITIADSLEKIKKDPLYFLSEKTKNFLSKNEILEDGKVRIENFEKL